MRQFDEMKNNIKMVVDRLPKKDNDLNGMTMQNCSIELYPNTESYDFADIMHNLNDYCTEHNCQYAIMHHDQDIYYQDTYSDRVLIGRKGQPKADHYHYLIHFPHRMVLTDFADKIGIEPRWIKRLKKDQDFDNMLIYLTHIRYPEDEKHHYPVDDFNSNITDYIRYLYDLEIQKQEQVQNNIVNDTIEILKSDLDHKFSIERIIIDLETYDYQISDILKYYRIIKDLVYEHNIQIESLTIIDQAKAEAMKKAYNDKVEMFNVADTFGSTKVEFNDKNYMLVRTEKGKKK